MLQAFPEHVRGAVSEDVESIIVVISKGSWGVGRGVAKTIVEGVFAEGVAECIEV